MAWREISLEEAQFNAFTKIEDWALLAAGTPESYNMLTITGLMCGQLFLRKMIEVYVHPARYSYRYMEENPVFTVSFFAEPRHPALAVCGRVSGRDCDKGREAGLTPVPYRGTVLFEEAQTVFVCRKVLHFDVAENSFDDPQVLHAYYKGTTPYHRIYMGEVEAVLTRQEPAVQGGEVVSDRT